MYFRPPIHDHLTKIIMFVSHSKIMRQVKTCTYEDATAVFSSKLFLVVDFTCSYMLAQTKRVKWNWKYGRSIIKSFIWIINGFSRLKQMDGDACAKSVFPRLLRIIYQYFNTIFSVLSLHYIFLVLVDFITNNSPYQYSLNLEALEFNIIVMHYIIMGSLMEHLVLIYLRHYNAFH